MVMLSNMEFENNVSSQPRPVVTAHFEDILRPLSELKVKSAAMMLDVWDVKFPRIACFRYSGSSLIITLIQVIFKRVSQLQAAGESKPPTDSNTLVSSSAVRTVLTRQATVSSGLQEPLRNAIYNACR